jgi:hypothetical protein
LPEPKIRFASAVKAPKGGRYGRFFVLIHCIAGNAGLGNAPSHCGLQNVYGKRIISRHSSTPGRNRASLGVAVAENYSGCLAHTQENLPGFHGIARLLSNLQC